MNSSIDLKKWHSIYQDMPRDIKAAIDAAFDAAAWSLKNDGFECLGDDRAEELIAAITCYVRVEQPCK